MSTSRFLRLVLASLLCLRRVFCVRGVFRLRGWLRGMRTAAAVVALSGCLPQVRPAPFPADDDTTLPGSLMGPFEGRVADAQSGRPLPGAIVWVAWSFCRGEAVCAPAGTETWSGDTDADGHYASSALQRFPGAVRLDHVTLIVYKRGYVGYRSDRYFEGAQPRRDFAQRHNQVKLDRFPESASHAEHLAFIGGSGALRAALRAEALHVSVDAGNTDAAPATLDASTLLSVEELRQVTGATDDFVTERLADKPRSAHYDSNHFKSTSRGEEADAAVRIVLADSDLEIEKDYEEIAPQLPNGRALDPVPTGLGARAAFGQQGDGDDAIFGIAALDRADRAVVLITCGAGTCKSQAELMELTKKVIARLPRVGRGPLPAGSPGSAPSTPTPAPMKLKQQGLHR